MKFNYAVLVGTTPERAVVPNPKRTSLTIFNNSTTTPVYYGADSGLSTTEGMVILPQTGWSFLDGLGDDPQTAFYLVVASGTADVRIAEGYAPPEKSTPVKEA
ncbi:MAG: hypothetical protein PHQ43_15010 [Dehalococcoidales bacterium]|nr:hypothetical protein [Dehalococcoidales bacterium]